LQLETPLETVIAAAQAAKSHGARVILDPAPAPQRLSLELLRNVDILTPNETEAAQLVGAPVRTLSPQQARDIGRQLQSSGPKTVIMKLGAQGCLLMEREALPRSRRQWCRQSTPRRLAMCSTALWRWRVRREHLSSKRVDLRPSAAALSVTRLGAQRSMPSSVRSNGSIYEAKGLSIRY
jgi:ribokinase